MAALGQTVSGVAHELNNPLATILSWAERLSQRTALEDPVRRGLETILSESERAARIVRNLLTFARKRQTTRAMVDVNQVARETLALRAYEQRVTNITVDRRARRRPAAGVRRRPSGSAGAAEPRRSTPSRRCSRPTAAASSSSARGTTRIRKSVVLEINDDGPGIPDDLQPKIFDPFFTTKEVGKGTGLGLTVAYAIVQEHGGRIRLESRPDAGASFYVELPVTGVEAAADADQRRARSDRPRRSPARRSSSSRTRPSWRARSSTRCGTPAYIVDHAAGRRGGAGQGRRRSPSTCVICDLKMPRVDGKAFYRMLVGRGAGTARSA